MKIAVTAAIVLAWVAFGVLLTQAPPATLGATFVVLVTGTAGIIGLQRGAEPRD